MSRIPQRRDQIDTQPDASTARLARAVVYLRVSTKEQAERGGNAEGFSIPAQREACQRKAAAIGAEVIEEFIDAGESAKTAHRPELQRMLAYLREEGATYVICHKIDRLARNRVDDVEINVAIRSAGATLVSCTENIDETPSGALMHGIMSSIAEFYSKNLANEVIKGSIQKAKAGGTVGKAPTGYLNVRRWENGRENRTVEVDPVRGPIMRWVFEQYATGEWSLRQLLAAATEKGLTSSGGPRTASKPLSLSNFNRLLRTPYYYGLIVYRGVEYNGAHEPLISKAMFDRVQAVLQAHALSGEKQRIHNHFLKGTIFCKQCGSRLGVMNSKNRYGTVYPYFYCSGKQEKRTNCTQRTVRIEEVEERVEGLWHDEQLTLAERNALAGFIRSELSALDRGNVEERERQQKRIEQLTSERRKLLQAHYADALPMDLLKSEQKRITDELEAAERLLHSAEANMQKVIIAVERALALLVDSHRTYCDQSVKEKRRMNQALFSKILVGDDGTIEGIHSPEYELLLHEDVRDEADAVVLHSHEVADERTSNGTVHGSNFDPHQQDTPGTLGFLTGIVGPRCRARTRNTRTSAAFAGRGSRNDWLVGEGGLEPPHSYLY
jgi:site-specific DNA recombinase